MPLDVRTRTELPFCAADQGVVLPRFGGPLVSVEAGEGSPGWAGRRGIRRSSAGRWCRWRMATDTSWASAARRLGVNETTLRNWVHVHLAEEARAADPLKVSPSEFEELRRLRAENAELKVEKEILREAAAYFARETIRSAASGSSPSTGAPGASSGSAGSSGSRGRPLPGRRGGSPAGAGPCGWRP
jgi:transposase